MKAIRIKFLYNPSPEAWRFHSSRSQYRMLIWGVKGGKTLACAVETIRAALAMPGALLWVVAPTYKNLNEARRALQGVIDAIPGVADGTTFEKRMPHAFNLPNGARIELHSAEWPDGLRGPNVDYLWIDEAGHVKPDARDILFSRNAATGGDIVMSGTPSGRNWFWSEAQRAGLPPEGKYGEYSEKDGFVSHRPTWEFPWVKSSHIERERQTMPRLTFDREYGAMFIGDANRAFHHVDEAKTIEPPEKLDGDTVMGVDLAKQRDWTAVVVMAANGRVLWCDRWNRTEWRVQMARIDDLAKRWRASIVLDTANIGSVIEGELRALGLKIHPVNMNDSNIVRDLFESAQVALESHHVKIPDPRAEWSPPASEQLEKELNWVEVLLTTGGRIRYDVAQGLSKDLAVAFCLAVWGMRRGFASAAGESVAVMSDDLSPSVATPGGMSSFRSRTMGSVFRRGEKRLFSGSDAGLWR